MRYGLSLHGNDQDTAKKESSRHEQGPLPKGGTALAKRRGKIADIIMGLFRIRAVLEIVISQLVSLANITSKEVSVYCLHSWNGTNQTKLMLLDRHYFSSSSLK